MRERCASESIRPLADQKSEVRGQRSEVRSPASPGLRRGRQRSPWRFGLREEMAGKIKTDLKVESRKEEVGNENADEKSKPECGNDRTVAPRTERDRRAARRECHGAEGLLFPAAISSTHALRNRGDARSASATSSAGSRRVAAFDVACDDHGHRSRNGLGEP